ncbi:hypothetical protein ABZ678_32195 [Streptomyces hirsutus]|uniref:hypothetical protein n=1 Tax=Streptomyces hirsutus TaxID=35620 RepID=UPI0033DAAAF3
MTQTGNSDRTVNGDGPQVDTTASVTVTRWPSEREGRRRRLATLASTLLVCALVLQLDSDATDTVSAPTEKVSAPPTSSPSPSAVAASPLASPPAPSPTEPEFPDTPAGRLDKKAYESNWEVEGEEYASASEYVNDVCQKLKGGLVELGDWWFTPEQYLAEEGELTKDRKKILRSGIPQLCPKRWPQVERAMNKTYKRAISNGTYDVAAKGGPEVMPPGTYRTDGGPLGDITDCYWERTTGSGEIVDNNFATVARSITVTVRRGELFTTSDCGVWMPVE